MAGWLVQKSVEIDSVGHPIFFVLSRYTPFQPKDLSPTFTHWVRFLGIYATEMINPLYKHCALGISIFIVSVYELFCTYW